MLTDRFFPSVSTFLTPNPRHLRRRRTCAARDQTRQGQRTAQVSAARDRHGSSARGFRVASGRCRRRVKEAAIADQGMQRRLTAAAPVVEDCLVFVERELVFGTVTEAVKTLVLRSAFEFSLAV